MSMSFILYILTRICQHADRYDFRFRIFDIGIVLPNNSINTSQHPERSEIPMSLRNRELHHSKTATQII